MTTMVNTVRGGIAPEQLGKTLMHEHFIFGYPGYQGDSTLGPFDRAGTLDDLEALVGRIKSHGVQTVVDATPNECGRDPEFLRELAERSDLNIICATGFYYEGEGAPAYFKFRANLMDISAEIYEMFMAELTVGIGKTGIKAGVIKLASSKDVMTDYERAFFVAGARAQRETGVPIITHTQEGTLGPEQAELLIAEGADPARIMIGHMDGNPNPEYHMRTLAHGVSIGFDRCGIQVLVGMPFDEDRVRVLTTLLQSNYVKQIMLSQDTVMHWLGRPLVLPEMVQQIMANWHPTNIFDNIIPALVQNGSTAADIQTMVIDNPRRLFGGS
ncbi:MAG: phosphotriesterase [Herpetosiphonaceae bacterium]|nr:phosphotriesterase [Herpetosiphonaceae bacterium]